jgi:hypothetical protein
MRIATQPDLARLAAATSPAAAAVPGFVVPLHAVADHPELRPYLERWKRAEGQSGYPFLVVSPDETRALFPELEEPLTQALKLVLHHATEGHPVAQALVGAGFIVWDGKRLLDASRQPGADKAACFIKAVGLGVDTVSLVGDVSPGLGISPQLTGGLSLMVLAAGSARSGEAPTTMEVLAIQDERLEGLDVLMKVGDAVQKVGVAAFDPRPELRALQPVRL